MIIVVSILFFAAIFFLVKYIQEKMEMKNISGRIENEKTAGKPALFDVFKVALKTIAVLNKKLPIAKYRKNTERKLYYAKVSNIFEPDEFLSLKETAVGLTALVYLVLFDGIDVIGFILCALSFFFPDLWLKEKRDSFEKEISKNLCYALDLITVCVEAGLTFDGAVSKFVLKAKNSFLKSEFTEMLKDVRLGKSRMDALKDMSERVNMPDFSSFVSSVVQSDRLGTSLAGTLRIQAAQIRTKRTQRIEKMAMQAPVKLLIPLVIFIFPVIFIMLFGPLVLKLLKIF